VAAVAEATTFDLSGLDRAGPTGAAWSLPHGGDLDGNVVVVQPGEAMGAHVNSEVDVLFVGLAGAGVLTVGADGYAFHAGVLVLVPKGEQRAVRTEGTDPLVYATVHRRRAGIGISPRR
jgi:mannose-6-phosphate isomerase-like protein (cupin superfamily)